MRTIVLGPSGSGKTTLTLELATLGAPVLDCDSIAGLGSHVNVVTGEIVPWDDEASRHPDVHYIWDVKVLIRFLIEHDRCILAGVSHNAFDLAWLFDHVIVLAPCVEVVTEEKVADFLAERRNPYNPYEDLVKWAESSEIFVRQVNQTYRATTFAQRYDGRLPRAIKRHLESQESRARILKSPDWLSDVYCRFGLLKSTAADRVKVKNLQDVKRSNPMKDAFFKEKATKGDSDYQLAWIMSEIWEYLNSDPSDQEHCKLEAMDFILMPKFAYDGNFDCISGEYIKGQLLEQEFIEIKEILSAVLASYGDVLEGGYASWNAKNVAKGRESRPWDVVKNALWECATVFQEKLTL
jgi:hypothetical protein